MLTTTSIMEASPSAAKPIVTEYSPVTYQFFVISKGPPELTIKTLIRDKITHIPKIKVVKTEANFGNLLPKKNIIINPKIGRTGIIQIIFSKLTCLFKINFVELPLLYIKIN